MKVKNNPYLRLISLSNNNSISAGKRSVLTIFLLVAAFALNSILLVTFALIAAVYLLYRNWKTNQLRCSIGKTNFLVFETYKRNADLVTFFHSLSLNLRSLVFDSQGMIEHFVKEKKDWLRTDGYGTFFLFTQKVHNEEEFFVADVRIRSNELTVEVFPLSSERLFSADAAHRIVVPEREISEPRS